MSEETQVNTKVMINNKEYIISPLRCKHLKIISEMLHQEPASVYESLERWFPLISDSIKVRQADFNQNELEELTLEQVLTLWQNITSISGIKFTNQGEVKPTQ